jgi:hypothetical protein
MKHDSHIAFPRRRGLEIDKNKRSVSFVLKELETNGCRKTINVSSLNIGVHRRLLVYDFEIK